MYSNNIYWVIGNKIGDKSVKPILKRLWHIGDRGSKNQEGNGTNCTCRICMIFITDLDFI